MIFKLCQELLKSNNLKYETIQRFVLMSDISRENCSKVHIMPENYIKVNLVL